MSILQSPAAIVPVQLSCRYANGMVMKYSGRLVSWDGESNLHVLSTEKFDVGIALTAVSSRLTAPTACRVARVTRSVDQPGFFLIELLAAVGAAKPVSASTAISVSASVSAALPSVLEAVVAQGTANVPVPESFRAAADLLGSRLILADEQATLADVLSGVTPAQVELCVWAAAAAVLRLVDRKGLADSRSLVRSLLE